MGVALEGKTNLSVYVDSELHTEVRSEAVKRGLSLGGVVEQALQAWTKKMKTTNPLDDEPLENMALQELALMTRKKDVKEAVVFIGPAGSNWKPLPTKDGGPDPLATAVLELPFRGTVVSQGFARVLNEAQKAVIIARFPGRKHVWGSLT
jgi:hypothetical protein